PFKLAWDSNQVTTLGKSSARVVATALETDVANEPSVIWPGTRLSMCCSYATVILCAHQPGLSTLPSSIVSTRRAISTWAISFAPIPSNASTHLFQDLLVAFSMDSMFMGFVIL